MSNKNIFWHTHHIGKKEHSQQKKQKAFILWFTGLSGSGKSTIANAVEQKLFELHKHTYLLDGDNIRMGINIDLGFSDNERIENIRRVGEVSKLFIDAGIIILAAFISPFQKGRNIVRQSVEKDEFIEVFIDTPLYICQARDPKKLYEKAKNDEVSNFTGISSSYEIPEKPEIHIFNDGHMTIESIAEQIIEYLKNKKYLV